MANKRLSKEKQALVLAALCEGTPIRACARMFHSSKNAIKRVIRETGEAFADYMDKNFRDLPCIRIEIPNKPSLTLRQTTPPIRSRPAE